MTTKAQLDKMDADVAKGMTSGKRTHGMVKYIRYAANRAATGVDDGYPDGPYSEAQVRSALKRMEKAGDVESRGWAPRITWTYLTDEMKAEREKARNLSEARDRQAEAIQVALGLGPIERDEDGDKDWETEHVETHGQGLQLSAEAVVALAARLGVEALPTE